MDPIEYYGEKAFLLPLKRGKRLRRKLRVFKPLLSGEERQGMIAEENLRSVRVGIKAGQAARRS